MSDLSEARRAARTHRDAMHPELAVLPEQGRREVLDADARSAGDDDNVRIGRERLENRARLVANETWKIDDGAVAPGERGQHRTVCVRDRVTLRRRSRGEQLVAGDRQS